MDNEEDELDHCEINSAAIAVEEVLLLVKLLAEEVEIGSNIKNLTIIEPAVTDKISIRLGSIFKEVESA